MAHLMKHIATGGNPPWRQAEVDFPNFADLCKGRGHPRVIAPKCMIQSTAVKVVSSKDVWVTQSRGLPVPEWLSLSIYSGPELFHIQLTVPKP
jgi:hypothetical protein